MNFNDFSSLLAVSPTAAIMLYMWMNRRPEKEDRSDPVKELTAEISSVRSEIVGVRERLVRIETRLDLKDKE